MNEYDSILREKKKKKVVVEEQPKKFPKFWVSLLLIILVLVISYVIYFNKILSAKNIVLNDSLEVLKKYSSLIKNVPVNEFSNEKNLVGTISYGSDKYNFNLVKNNDNLGFNISNNDKYINYYLVDNKAYVKVPSVNEFVSLDYTFSINTLLKFSDILDNISEDKLVKNVYFLNQKPVVEVNLSFDSKRVNEIFELSLKDDYSVIVTFKNSAIMNEVLEIKIAINNETKSDRRVITMNGNNITYTVGGDTYSIVLEESDNDFTIRTSKNDILYSVFRGIDNEDNYQYSYQIIDKVYNINLFTYKNSDGYKYELKSKKNEIEEVIDITLNIENSYLIEHDAANFIDYSNQLVTSKYNNDINYFKDKFLKFVEQSYD